MVIASFSN